MSITGTWEAVLKSPMGPMNVTFDITEDNGVITGEARDKRQVMQIENGRSEGNHWQCVFNLKGIMKMKLELEGEVDGDQMTGTVTVGKRGTFPFTGQRAG